MFKYPSGAPTSDIPSDAPPSYRRGSIENNYQRNRAQTPMYVRDPSMTPEWLAPSDAPLAYPSRDDAAPMPYPRVDAAPMPTWPTETGPVPTWPSEPGPMPTGPSGGGFTQPSAWGDSSYGYDAYRRPSWGSTQPMSSRSKSRMTPMSDFLGGGRSGLTNSDWGNIGSWGDTSMTPSAGQWDAYQYRPKTTY